MGDCKKCARLSNIRCLPIVAAWVCLLSQLERCAATMYAIWWRSSSTTLVVTRLVTKRWCLLPTAYRLSPVAYPVSPVAHRLTPMVYRHLPIAYRLWRIAYRLSSLRCKIYVERICVHIYICMWRREIKYPGFAKA